MVTFVLRPLVSFLRRLTTAQRIALASMIAILILADLPFVTTGAVAASTPDESSPEFKKIFSEGNALIVKGRSSYRDAIGKFTEALSLVPNSVKARAARAELYVMLKEWNSALDDANQVLAVDPKHRKALETRAKLLSSGGDLVEASQDYQTLAQVFTEAKNAKKAEESRKTAHRMAHLGHQWNAIKQSLDEDTKGDAHRRLDNARRCTSVLRDIIAEFSKDNMKLRLQRAECGVVARDHAAVSDEIKVIHAKEPNNLAAIALSARAFRTLGALDRARAEVKRCLSLDPEDATCMKMHKSFKSYQKHVDGIEEAVKEKKWKVVLQLVDECFKLEEDPPNLEQLWRWKCEAYLGLRDVEQGVAACTQSINIEGGNDEKSPSIIDSLLRRADLHFINDDLDKAEQDIRRAAEINPNHQGVKDSQSKLENLRQQASRKDYYKILGVKKTAGEAEIHRQYRKLARSLHPDVLRSKKLSDDERAKADARYRDINEAKEVLLNSEKRQRYDNGEDVTKPPGQGGGQHHQFHHGGFPGGFPGFGGGGGGFQFHFG